MTTYKVENGHDIALLDLDDIVPQPSTIGLQYARRSFAASGAVIDENAFIELEFNTLNNVTQYTALLTQFGLSSATTADVTVYIPNANYAWTRMNGTAVRPQIGTDGIRSNYFLRGFTILVKGLRTVA